MDSAPPPATGKLAKDLYPFFRVYKDGRVERFLETKRVPPSDDQATVGVRSKDVIISPVNKVGARLFLPSGITSDEKLPILFYIHGGGFSFESAFSSLYTDHLNKVVGAARVLAVSVEYRLAPEHPIPACYDDSWTALIWVNSHTHVSEEQGIEPWIKDHGNFNRVFLAGDSGGGNIAHNLMARASMDPGRLKLNLVGMALVHPFFGNGKYDRVWDYICPNTKFEDDPRLNPMAHPDLLAGLICKKILIFTAEKDFLRERAWLYYEALKKSGWGGEVHIKDTHGEQHVFHLIKPNCINAQILMNHFVSMFTHHHPRL